MWFAAFLLLCSSADAHAAVRTLIAIGNDVGLSNETPLRWAEEDAKRIHDVFTDLGGVSRARAILLLGASAGELERTLLEVKGQIAETKRRGERAELFLSFSGHGDRDALHLASDRLATKRLLQWVDAIDADATVVVLDACRTGPVRAGQRRGFGQGPAFDVTLIESPAPVGRVVLSSASEGEVAQESDDLEGAFFTHHLLAGLRGAADGDTDGAVTLTELWRYAHGRTVDASFGRASVQHPEVVLDLSGQADLVLTRTDRAAARLNLAADLVGSFLIVDERTSRVLFEVNKATGAALTLAVPPRRLRVQWRDGSRFAVTDVALGRGDTATLQASAFELLPRLAGRTRGADIDLDPWGAVVAMAATLPPTVEGGALGVYFRGDRRFWTSPFFVELNARVSRADGKSETRVYEESDALATIGLGAEAWTFVGRFNIAASAGAHVIAQRVTRLDAARLNAAGIFDIAPTTLGWTWGPVAMGRASWAAPILGPVSVEAGVTASARLLRLDGEEDFAFGAGMYCGINTEF